ncbi:MAG: glutathione S-transferase family protein [Bacteriovoracia bacterium]
MSYILVGSYASLFVRRIRMAMEHIPFEFKVVNLWEEVGAAEIKKLNPINQIPCLIDNGEVIWDSRIILQHLAKKHQWPSLSLEAQDFLALHVHRPIVQNTHPSKAS